LASVLDNFIIFNNVMAKQKLKQSNSPQNFSITGTLFYVNYILDILKVFLPL